MSSKQRQVQDLKKGDLVKTGDVWREVKNVVPVDKNGTTYQLELEGATPVDFPSLMVFEKHVCAANPITGSGMEDVFGGLLGPRAGRHV